MFLFIQCVCFKEPSTSPPRLGRILPPTLIFLQTAYYLGCRLCSKKKERDDHKLRMHVAFLEAFCIAYVGYIMLVANFPSTCNCFYWPSCFSLRLFGTTHILEVGYFRPHGKSQKAYIYGQDF